MNTLIKKVRKKEVRKQGVNSKAQHAITQLEFFRRMQHILKEKNDVIRSYGIPSLLMFQYNLIARIVDTTQFQMEILRSNQDSTSLYKVN